VGCLDRRDAEGAVAIIVATLMLVIMGLAAIVVDLGFARDRVRVAQNAADAAALAAALCLSAPASGCNPTTVATDYVAQNGWPAAGTVVTLDNAAETVTVQLAAQKSPGFFSGAIGVGTPDVNNTAKATWRNSSPVTCVLCVLNDFTGGIGDIALSGGLAVNGALTFSNANGSVRLAGSGTASWFGSQTRGTFTLNGVPFVPARLASAVPDPFLGKVPTPTTGLDGINLATPPTRGNGGACPPGNYIDLSNCTSLVGNGIYIVSGTQGGTAITVPGADAPNTLIYLGCGTATGAYRPCASTGEVGAHLAGTGQSVSVVHGRTGGAYTGFAVVYDPNNAPDEKAAKVAGNGNLTIAGNLYEPRGTIDFRGNGSIKVDGVVVVRDVFLHGNGKDKDHITDVGDNSVPAAIAPGTPVHLTS
jgi:Flp pilus assembly protein TadG